MNARDMPRMTARRMALPILAAGLLAIGPAAPKPAIEWFADICSAASDPLLAVAPSGNVAANRPRASSSVLSCEPLPHVPGKSIITTIVDFPPMAYTPAHRHPGSVTAVVLQGTVRSQMEGGPVADFHIGQTWFEPPRALHLFAENPDPVYPAKLLATFVADSGCGSLVLPADDGEMRQP